MGSFDALLRYQRPQLDLFSEADGLGAAIGRNRRNSRLDAIAEEKARIDDARQQASQAFMEGQTAAANRSAAEREWVDRQKFNQTTQAANTTTFENTVKKFNEGGENEAAAYAKSREYFDPYTGATQGIKFKKSGFVNGQDSGLKAKANPFDSVAPPTPEEQQQPADDYKHFVNLLRTPQVQKFNASITAPDGTEMELDPKERDRYKQQQAEEHKQQLLSILPTIPPELRPALLARAGLTGAQATGAEAAPVMNSEAQHTKQNFEAEQNKRYKLTAEQQEALKQKQIAAQKARGAGGPKPVDPMKAAKADDQHAAASDLAFGRFAQQQGVAKTFAQAEKYNEMADQLGAHNAALDKAAAGTWVKMAQGGTGVISDQDMNQFWKDIGSAGLKMSDNIQGIIDGTIHPEKRAVVMGAIATLKKNTESHLTRLASQAEAMEKAGPFKDQWERRRVGHFPWYKNRLDDDGKPLAPPVVTPPPAVAGTPVQHKVGDTKDLGGGVTARFNGVKFVPVD